MSPHALPEAAPHAMPYRRFRQRASLLLLVAYWLALAAATHVPRLPQVVGTSGIDKVCHFAGFFGLGFLASLTVAIWRPASRPLNWINLAGIGLLLAIYGASDELTQPLVGRSCELADWLADLAGLTMGIASFVVAKTLARWLSANSASSGKHVAV